MRIDLEPASRLRARAALAALLCLSCATAPAATREVASGGTAKDVVARTQLRSALDELPSCTREVEGSMLIISPGECTQLACAQACCNACGWRARAQSGAVDAARVKALLKLPDSSMDCEIAMWSEVLSAYQLNVTQGCVKR